MATSFHRQNGSFHALPECSAGFIRRLSAFKVSFILACAKYLISLEWQIVIAIIIVQFMPSPLHMTPIWYQSSVGLQWDTKLPQTNAWIVCSPRFQIMCTGDLLLEGSTIDPMGQTWPCVMGGLCWSGLLLNCEWKTNAKRLTFCDVLAKIRVHTEGSWIWPDYEVSLE